MICMIVILLLLDVLVGLFGEDVTPQIVRYAHQFMNCCMVGYIPLAFLFVFRSTMQGMGYGNITLLCGISELVARAFVVAVLAKNFGYGGICWGHTVAWTLAVVPVIPFYRKKMKEKVYG